MNHNSAESGNTPDAGKKAGSSRVEANADYLPDTSRIRLPAVFTGLLFSIIGCALTPYNNINLQNSPLSGGHFPLLSFAILLFLLAAVNPALSLINKKWRLYSREVLLIWAMTALSGGIAYTGLMRTFLINITSPGWMNLFGNSRAEIPYATHSLFPQNPDLIRNLYSGLEGGLGMSWLQILARIPWSEWVVPFFLWMLFILLVYSALFGMMGLFSHQWIENEKMNFPLLQVPMDLSLRADQHSLWRFFRNRYFIIGLGFPVLLHTLNGLHTYFPEIPQIPTMVLAQPYIPPEGILSGLYKAKIYIIPAFIGFAFLAPKQISFSFWFFFLLGGLFPGFIATLGWKIPSASIGVLFGPTISRVEEMQMIGAFAVFFFFIIWLARYHLISVLREIAGSGKGTENFHGLISPRISVFLFLVGMTGVWIWLSFFGMGFFSAAAFLAVCFMLQLVTARLVCQGGLPYFTIAVAPSDGFLALFGSQWLQSGTVFLGAVVQKITFVDVRESLAPSLFHASKLSDGSRPRRLFVWGVWLAIVAGILVSFISMLALYYKFGINSLPDSWAVESTRKVHENAAFLLKHAEGPNRWAAIFSIAGAACMTLLVVGYQMFIWWPLHPIGYLTAYSSAMQILWFGFFVGWSCNALVLRYGGVSFYHEVKNLFIGLVTGDMLMALVWLMVGTFAPFSYHVLPL
ncbi:MAG: DUF6785 family protein [Syntrophobacteraceae bacterium]